jgi:hypothetical protein
MKTVHHRRDTSGVAKLPSKRGNQAVGSKKSLEEAPKRDLRPKRRCELAYQLLYPYPSSHGPALSRSMPTLEAFSHFPPFAPPLPSHQQSSCFP